METYYLKVKAKDAPVQLWSFSQKILRQKTIFSLSSKSIYAIKYHKHSYFTFTFDNIVYDTLGGVGELISLLKETYRVLKFLS